MKAYLITTGILFAVLTAVHIWRMFVEFGLIKTDPWFLVITALSAALSLWAWRLLRRSPSP